MKHTPTPLTYAEDAIDGYESIVIQHNGCPILTIRGLDDMGCIEQEDEAKVAAEVVATADRVIMTYNHHDQLVDTVKAMKSLIESLGRTDITYSVVYKDMISLLNSLDNGK
jgi:Xaa-Pro aminopeptidase